MLNTEQCWAAVIAHDATQDGRFFYSVKTTGVYCRPVCPARTPSARNIRFGHLPPSARHVTENQHRGDT